ncbi:O-methyltransferase [Paraburkholderia sp. DHOC27]|uniref:O-methyltransferase n=1 Tax=Paraburkholderia sp. DHOC27 TaxID=2303330 RepID=UPI000E3C8C59|nr:O-methyltransferase [Paraburkholderia sp. DHOC27]RFU44976.1 O-methyltransferase [Paraburkholderia sp. DHOC27]
MDQESWDALDHFFCEQLLSPDLALDSALESSAEAGLRSINVSPNQGKFLQLLARIHGARRILEIGTLGGYSAIWMARALPSSGTLISLEIDPQNAEVARANLARAGMGSVASVLVGTATELLKGLIDERAEPFDMVFIDADKKSYPDYLLLSLQLLRPGGIIVADNVARGGRVIDPDNHEDDIVGLRKFFRMLASDTRLSTTAMQTVGSKGWDGFSLTRLSTE